MRSPRLARRAVAVTVTLTCAVASGAAFSQDNGDEGIRIQGQPVVTTEGWNRFGIRNQKVELTQNISYADLNLATRSGVNELKARVHDAASAVCTKLGHFDEGRGAIAAEEDQVQCVNSAVDDAMPQVKRAIESERQSRGPG